MVSKRIRAGKATIEAVEMRLGARNLVVLRGSKGYVMCGYLNLDAAGKFNEAAIKITGVATIRQALRAKVSSCTPAAKRLGVYKGQAVKDALKIVA